MLPAARLSIDFPFSAINVVPWELEGLRPFFAPDCTGERDRLSGCEGPHPSVTDSGRAQPRAISSSVRLLP